MQRASHIFFEKHLQDGTIPTDKLISVSEARRRLFQSFYYDRDILQDALHYEEKFKWLRKNIVKNNSKLLCQPLFQWEGHGSSCFLFEKLNLEKAIMDAYATNAVNNIDLKLKRQHYKDAIKYSIKCLKTLGKYRWSDSSISYIPIMQYRYHVYYMTKYLAEFYRCMYDYSIENDKPNKTCLKKAYDSMNIAANIWISKHEDNVQLHKLKCLLAMETAEEFEDDRCGEKLGLIKDYVQMTETPDIVKKRYDLWKTQNDSVYYKIEETNIKITPSSLDDVFRSLSKIFEHK